MQINSVKIMRKKTSFLLFLYTIFLPSLAFAYETEIHHIDILNHQFFPQVIKASPNKVIKLEITNKDKTVEEFESLDLKREKIIPTNKKIIITVGPLKPGEYKFFGDFHQDTAQGKIIIK